MRLPSVENRKGHLPSMPSRKSVCQPPFGKPGRGALRHVLCAILLFVLLFVAGLPGEVWADGIFDGISGYVEMNYSYGSFRTTDSSGNTTKTELNNYNPRAYLELNFDLYPKLNLNTGVNFDMNIVEPVNADSGSRSEVRRFRPFVWLSLRDPVYNATVGYAVNEATTTLSGQKTTLTQETYNAFLNWRPEGLPSTKLLFTQTNTSDEPRSAVDTQKDYLYLKSEYVYKGLDVWYAGTYQKTQDKIRDFDTTQLSNEGRLIYNTTFFNGRTSINTDNRVVFSTFESTREVGLPVFPFAGLASLNDTLATGALASTPALIDGNLTVFAGAGLDLVLPAVNPDPRRRNIGVDFLTAVEVNSLQVWVNVTDLAGGTMNPQDVATRLSSALFTWEIYTSADNLNWTLYRAGQSAPFGPFDSRFEISFPSVRTRYIKVVTTPVPLAAVSTAPAIGQIAVTEIQAFLNTSQIQPLVSTQGIKTKTNQTYQYYSLDARTRLLDSPLLSYFFTAYYTDLSPNGRQQYDVTNGLQFNYIINRYLSTNANASVDVGAQGDLTNLNVAYTASLLATPLRTLSNSLVFSGNNQRIGDATDVNNSVVLYNTAQIYKGIDANLNLGWVSLSHEDGNGVTRNQNDVYINVGTTVTPTPNMTLTFYYLGRKSNLSGSDPGASADIFENRLDFGASWAPFPTLSLSALVNASFVSGSSASGASGQRDNVQQNYGLSWTPFPDGQVQFSFFASQSYYGDNARTFQPTLRWYLTPRRRSFLDLSYLNSNTNSSGSRAETNVFSTTLKVFF